jgi:hypothetical protein
LRAWLVGTSRERKEKVKIKRKTKLRVEGVFEVDLEFVTEPGEDYEILSVKVDGQDADWLLDGEHVGLCELVEDWHS